MNNSLSLPLESIDVHSKKFQGIVWLVQVVSSWTQSRGIFPFMFSGLEHLRQDHISNPALRLNYSSKLTFVNL
jgi:hypothetical protein